MESELSKFESQVGRLRHCTIEEGETGYATTKTASAFQAVNLRWEWKWREVAENLTEMKTDLHQEFSYQLSPHRHMNISDTPSNTAS